MATRLKKNQREKIKESIKAYSIKELEMINIQELNKHTSTIGHKVTKYYIYQIVGTETGYHSDYGRIDYRNPVPVNVHGWEEVSKFSYDKYMDFLERESSGFRYGEDYDYYEKIGADEAKSEEVKEYKPLFDNLSFFEKRHKEKETIGTYNQLIAVRKEIAEFASIYSEVLEELYLSTEMDFLYNKMTDFDDLITTLTFEIEDLDEQLEAFRARKQAKQKKNKLRKLKRKLKAIEAEIEELEK